MSNVINIMLVDDHQMIKDGIKTMLKGVSQIKIVADANNGEEALELIKNKEVHVLLVDINMPGLSGIDVAHAIQEKHPDIKVLALSMHDEEDYILQMMKAGALGYILKTIGKKELITAIETVSKGQSYFSEEVSKTLLGQFVKPKIEQQVNRTNNNEVPLTDREKEILRLIAEEYTNQEIAEKLFISPRTVDTHRRNLLQKLSVKNTAGLVRYAMQHGIVQ